MRRMYFASSLLLLTSCLVAHEADHVWLYKVRNHIVKNYTFQNFKEIEAKYSIWNATGLEEAAKQIKDLYPNFLKDVQQNELLQQFKRALHSEDQEQSLAAHKILTTIQSDLHRRLEWFEHRGYSIEKRVSRSGEKAGISIGMALFSAAAGLSFDKPGIAISGFFLGYIAALVYAISGPNGSLAHKACYEELQKIATFLDEVAYGQEVKTA